MSALEKFSQVETAQQFWANLLLGNGLDSLSAEQKMEYYLRLCDSLGLNPHTKPFEFIRLQGRTILYAKRDCTDQLRRIHDVSIEVTSREFVNGLYVVCARATLPSGRRDESIGAVPVEGLAGETLANALMKAETKAKRRVTLNIVGLGFLDETEVESVQIEEAKPPQIPPSNDASSKKFNQTLWQIVQKFDSSIKPSAVKRYLNEIVWELWENMVGAEKPFNLDLLRQVILSREEEAFGVVKRLIDGGVETQGG